MASVVGIKNAEVVGAHHDHDGVRSFKINFPTGIGNFSLNIPADVAHTSVELTFVGQQHAEGLTMADKDLKSFAGVTVQREDAGIVVRISHEALRRLAPGGPVTYINLYR